MGFDDYRFCPFCGEKLKIFGFLGETCDCEKALYYRKSIREKQQLEKVLEYKNKEIQTILTQTIREQKISKLQKELDEIALKYRTPDSLCSVPGEKE